MNNILFLFAFTLILTPLLNGQGTKLLRQPTISSEQIVFSYANDLWTVDRNGGEAVRLTSNEGMESNPHFSPDEKWIAFTGQYDGNTDVYIIPKNGGTPKRLTYHPVADIVQGWTPSGEVLFQSSREGRPTQTAKLYTVSTDGSFPNALDIPRAAYGEISPDGKHLAYIPITAWDPEWRNYRGGQAMPVWIVDLESKELTIATQSDNERHLDPIWYGNKVYYLSERDYASNIWSFDPVTKEEKQITFHDQYDVKSLDATKDMIVYEQGGQLHLLDPGTGESKTTEISVSGDMNFSRPRWENIVARNLTNANISPTGQRAIFESRGEIFTFPKKEGSWRNLTNSPGSAERYPIWSPKGDKIAWFSDATGEYQLVVADQYGKVERSYELPDPTFYFTPDWSPDGSKIAFTDTDYNIWYVNLESGEVVKVDTDRYAHPNRSMNPKWSPDSKWIAYAKQQDSHFKSAFLYHVSEGSIHQVTDPIADVISPVWDESGDYLYLLASTDYGLNSGWLDMSSYDPQVNRNLYAIVLSSESSSPTLPKSDDEKVEKEEAKKEENGKKEDDKKDEDKEEEKDIVISLEGIQDRVVHLDIPSGNYIALVEGPKHSVIVVESENGFGNATIHKYDVKKNKAEELASGIDDIRTSADRKSFLLRKGGGWMIAGTGSPVKGKDGALKTNARILINPKAEYQQIFKEGWRFMRDFLYVDNVHGAPWDDVYDWYSPWIDHVRHRSDLNYVVDILSGEVAVGHSFVRGGDMPDLDRVPVGLLGCDFTLSGDNYVISKIYSGEHWNAGTLAPLAIPGIGVEEGDILLEVNGQRLTAGMNPYQLFEQTAGREIHIKVGKTADLAAAKEILVKPISSDRQLRYLDWIEGNRRKVDELSGGKLAYVYLPNTGGGGFTNFNRYYFSQQDKKGVIIDERNNGGGSAADYMIDIMNRKLFGYFNSRANDHRPWTTPMAGIWGPKVMIINERAGSGGDLLPYMFKAAGIGPLIGTKTWGGLVGTWDTPPFIDGGRMVAPRGGFFDVDGEWAVEGEGVAPDIEVIQHPDQTSIGNDPQLEAAVQEALRLLSNNEFQLKPEPVPPVRWKRPATFKNK
ncbi:MAG: protease [Saprospiraceae bacterium]|nr:protease [Saprospiraceae bacterium]